MKKIEKILLYACHRDILKKEITKYFNKYGLEYRELTVFKQELINDYDALFLIGTDRDLLNILQLMRENIIPILHISPPGYTGFFSSIEWNKLSDSLEKIVSGKYDLVEYMRLKTFIDNNKSYYGLNEIALFSSRSAVLVSYDLSVDDEYIWSDTSDGLIIATPTGSTAYAYSAGGPIVMRNTNVFVIVPVNSLNPMRRSLVVPGDSRIRVSRITSSYKCEAIIDGVTRVKVKEEISVMKAEKPALFIRLEKRLSEQIERKIKLAIEELDLPPSAKYVYKMLELTGEASVKDLVEITGLPERTVRHALSLLVDKGLVVRVFNLRDTRKRIYRITSRGGNVKS